MSSHDLHHVEIRSGVSEAGKPFCHLVVNHGDLMAQMSPDETRDLAMTMLSAAEAAESDAAVMGVLTDEVNLSIDVAATVLVRMRARRTPPPPPETAPDADVDGPQT